MTSVRWAAIACEVENCGNLYPNPPEQYRQYGKVTRSFAQIRQEAREAGWRTCRGTKYGNDICPGCVAAEAQPARPRKP